jgi:hypothetical protein
MSSFNYLPLILYADVDSIVMGRLFSLRPCKKLNFDETHLHWSGLYVTDPIRTIREMIDYGCQSEFVCQSIDWFRRYGKEFEMERDLEENGLMNKYQEYLDDMSFWGLD